MDTLSIKRDSDYIYLQKWSAVTVIVLHVLGIPDKVRWIKHYI